MLLVFSPPVEITPGGVFFIKKVCAKLAQSKPLVYHCIVTGGYTLKNTSHDLHNKPQAL